MNTYVTYINPLQEPDEREREKMMFFNPFQVPVIEGVPKTSKDADLSTVVILSDN